MKPLLQIAEKMIHKSEWNGDCLGKSQGDIKKDIKIKENGISFRGMEERPRASLARSKIYSTQGDIFKRRKKNQKHMPCRI
jgi:hypothetical protein